VPREGCNERLKSIAPDVEFLHHQLLRPNTVKTRMRQTHPLGNRVPSSDPNGRRSTGGFRWGGIGPVAPRHSAPWVPHTDKFPWCFMRASCALHARSRAELHRRVQEEATLSLDHVWFMRTAGAAPRESQLPACDKTRLGGTPSREATGGATNTLGAPNCLASPPQPLNRNEHMYIYTYYSYDLMTHFPRPCSCTGRP
jgi:hypothetical protein